MPSEILREHASDSQPVLWRCVRPVAAATQKITADQREFRIAQELEQARRDGFARGVASANQEADQELTPAIQKLAQAVAELAQLRECLRESAIQDLVQLAIAIASRVIQRQVAVEPDVLAGLLGASFSKLQAREVSRARIHPGFEGGLRRCLDQLPQECNLVLLPDQSIKPGELVFEFARTGDSPMEADFSEIERGLSDKLGQ